MVVIADDSGRSAPPPATACQPPPPVDHPLSNAVQPVRTILHGFLSDYDAGRLLRVSRTTAHSLLLGFTFQQHVFCCEDLPAMLTMKSLYETYGMRPTRMCLSEGMMNLSHPQVTGDVGSPFPSSLTSLQLGPLHQRSPVTDTFWTIFNEADVPHPRQLPVSLEDCYQAMTAWVFSDRVRLFSVVRSLFHCALAPGILPSGLRLLQFPSQYNFLLVPDAIPSTVEQLQLGAYDWPLMVRGVTVLPFSLRYLSLDEFDWPLEPGVFPPSLQRLSLSHFDHPLLVNVLPSSLVYLYLHWFDHPLRPGVLPVGLEELSLFNFNHELLIGSLPNSLISLDLGSEFLRPLVPGE